MIALLEARRAGLFTRAQLGPNVVAGVVVGIACSASCAACNACPRRCSAGRVRAPAV